MTGCAALRTETHLPPQLLALRSKLSPLEHLAFVGWSGPPEAFGLGPLEKAAARTFSAHRRLTFATGRLCAKQALTALGDPRADIGRQADGLPEWPAGTAGSISHAPTYTCAVVAARSKFRSLGIDVELRGRPAKGSWERFLSAEELRTVSSLPEEAQADRASEIFCAKESCLKCQFPLTGFAPDLRDLLIEQKDGGFNATYAGPNRSLSALSMDIRGALASRGDLTIALSWLPAGTPQNSR